MKIQKQASVLTAGTPDAEQLEKINRQAKSPLKAEEVYVFSVRLCDDQPDRDHERFSTEALKALAPMFVGKTGIVDHAWSSEKQVARIFEAGVEYGDGCAFLKAWAYILRGEKTQEIIREIEAGIKKEVSVGCAMRRSICSICGADYGSCEHRKGESYGGQTCVAVLCEPVVLLARPCMIDDARLADEHRRELLERLRLEPLVVAVCLIVAQPHGEHIHLLRGEFFPCLSLNGLHLGRRGGPGGRHLRLLGNVHCQFPFRKFSAWAL